MLNQSEFTDEEKNAIQQATYGQTKHLKPYSSDYKVILKAVQTKPNLFKFCSNELKKNFNICFEAVSRDPMNLEYVKEEVEKYDVLVTTAFDKKPDSIKFNKLNNDWKLGEHILASKASDRIKYMYPLLKDTKFIEKNLPKHPYFIREILTDFSYQRKYALMAIKNGFRLKHYLLLKNNFNVNTRYATRDQEICYYAMKNQGSDYKYVECRDINNEFHIEIAIESIKENKLSFKLLSPEFKKNLLILQVYNQIGLFKIRQTSKDLYFQFEQKL